MNQDEITWINKEAGLSSYDRNNLKSMGNEISDIVVRIETLEDAMKEGILSPEQYKDYVVRQRTEIKNMIAQIYSHANLLEVEGYFDKAFTKNDKIK